MKHQNTLFSRHGLYANEEKQHVHAMISSKLISEVDRVVPKRQRSAFLGSLIRRELEQRDH